MIKNVAIHDLKRDAGNNFEVLLGKTNLKISPTVDRVVETLHSFYNRRTSKSHGKFSEDDINYPTKSHFAQFQKSEFNDFDALTSAMMSTLRKSANSKPSATGGHVFFAHFERDDQQFILVAILQDKLGAALTTDFDVTDSLHLDMEGFKFAGRINISAWLDGRERYISFLKGKGDVAEYFKEFFGCDNTVQAKEDTLNLIKALKSFTLSKKFTHEQRDAFLKKARDFCASYSDKKEEISLETLSNSLSPDDPNALLEVLTDPELLLNDNFIPHKQSLGKLTKFKAKTQTWLLEFDRDAIHGGPIKYDSEKNILIIKNLPEDLITELKDEIGDDPDI